MLVNWPEYVTIDLMTIWPPLSETLKRPAYRSLAKSLVDAIQAGELKPGDRLPTHRDLAYRLGLSVQTVSRAYDSLIRTGVIAGEVGRGSFVRAGRSDGLTTPYLRLERGDDIIDCSILTPVTGELHSRRFRDTLGSLAEDLPAERMFSFRPRMALRDPILRGVDWLKKCGVEAEAFRVLPMNGNSTAMTVALMTAATPGDLMITDELSHHTLKILARSLGLKLTGLPSDDEGMMVEPLLRVCATEAVRLLYLMPAGLDPLARRMSAARRAQIVAVARRHDLTIIENDAWGPLEPDRPAPIVALAPERTFYFTGFSKCLLPGLRLGWLVTPEDQITGAAARSLAAQWMATALIAEIGGRWILDGTADSLLAWQRRALAERNALAAERLAGLRPHSNPFGLHVWLPLSEDWDEESFVAAARSHGVALASGAAFAVNAGKRAQGVRICLGAPSMGRLDEGLGIIARLARSTSDIPFMTP